MFFLAHLRVFFVFCPFRVSFAYPHFSNRYEMGNKKNDLYHWSFRLTANKHSPTWLIFVSFPTFTMWFINVICKRPSFFLQHLKSIWEGVQLQIGWKFYLTYFPFPEAFSLFNIVSFPNEECTTKSTNEPKGTCMTLDECNGQGGTSSANCASGFGVCCYFT